MLNRSGLFSPLFAPLMTKGVVGGGVFGPVGPTVFPTFAYEPETTSLVAVWESKGATVSHARRDQANQLYRKLKAANLLADCLALDMFVHGDAKFDTVNFAKPGTYDPQIVGAPTVVSRGGYTAVDNTSYIDSGVPANQIPANNFAYFVWTDTTSTSGSDCGVLNSAGSGYAIAAASASGQAQIRAGGASATVNFSGFTGSDGMVLVSRSNPSNFDTYKNSRKVATTTNATVSLTTLTETFRFLGNGRNGATPGASAKKQYCGGIFKRALTADEVLILHDAVRTYLEAVRAGEVRMFRIGQGSAIVSHQHVVFGTTSPAIAYAIEAKRRGEDVAIQADKREQAITVFGGMSANGLGVIDRYKPNAWGGLSRDIMESAMALGGASWATDSVLPNNFNREVRRRLEALDIPVYHSEGLDKVNVANKRIASVRTKEGRTINADYWHDGSYSILLAVRAGCSYIMGREAAGTGKEANNGWQGLSGAYSDARFQPSPDISPFIVPGDPSSGLIFGVSPTPVGKVVGTADYDTVQAVCFRWTLTTGSASSYPIPNVVPRNFDPARYELLARGFASGQYTLLEHVFNNYPASNVYDFNSRAVGSLDYYDAVGTVLKYYQALYAGDYASAEIYRQTILDHTYGLFYWLAYHPDARIPAAVRNTLLTYGYSVSHYYDRHPNDPPYVPQVMYERMGARLVGDFVMNGNDHDGVDGTAPRSIKTCGTIDYHLDNHIFGRYNDVSTGTPRVRNEGAMGDHNCGGTDGVSPIPFEAILPKASEIENLSVSFGISGTNVLTSASRMEIPAMQVAQSAAVLATVARANGKASLQNQVATNYPAIRAAILTAGDPIPANLPQVN